MKELPRPPVGPQLDRSARRNEAVSEHTKIDLVKDVERLETKSLDVDIHRTAFNFKSDHPEQVTPELERALSRIMAATIRFQRELKATLQGHLNINDGLWEQAENEYLSSADPNLHPLTR